VSIDVKSKTIGLCVAVITAFYSPMAGHAGIHVITTTVVVIRSVFSPTGRLSVSVSTDNWLQTGALAKSIHAITTMEAARIFVCSME
jgi:hypothetical protein